MLEELRNLILIDKFEEKVWLERGLNPSEKSLCLSLQNELNTTIDELIKSSSDIVIFNKVDVFRKALNNFNNYNLDTEEMELVVDYLSEISKLVNTEINEYLDIWLYGVDTSKIHKQSIKIINTFSQACKNCKGELRIDILTERKSITPFWEIVQCNNCKTIELLSIPEGIEKFMNGNFFVFEILKQPEYTLTKALDKMNFYIQANSM